MFLLFKIVSMGVIRYFSVLLTASDLNMLLADDL